jgi:ferredoxin
MLDPYSVAGNAMSGAWFGLGFVIALTVLVFFKKRFFCTNICPVGAVLGLISRFSLFKIRIDTDKCKMCSLCARSCPCGSIDFKNHTVDNETCVKCFKCLSYCSHGALYYGLPKTEKPAFNINRRKFITAGLVLATFGAAFKGGIELSKKMATKVKNVILPAGSGDVQDFANRCLNCNLCVQNCPMKIIKPANTKTPFVHLDYGDKYCDFNCHKCSSVCPSGAIKRMTLKEKQNTKIANAVIDEDVCIKCGICAIECPKKIIIKEDGELPIIQFDKCIGCGKCANACPVKAISIEPVNKQVTLI